MGNALSWVSDAISAPFKWTGDLVQWGGDRLGVREVSEAGRWLSDASQDPTVKTALSIAAPMAIGYYGAPYASSLMGAGEAGELGAFGANELATWGAGETGMGGWASVPELTGGASASSLLGGSTFGIPNSALGMGGLALGSQWLGANQQAQSIEDAQNRAESFWRNNAFPNQTAVNSQQTMLNSAITEEELKRRKKVNEDAARRGLGAKSGLRSQAYTDLAKASMYERAKAMNELIKYQNTPTFAPNMSVYNQIPTSFGERVSNMATGMAGTMGGLYALDWLKNR